MNIAICDDEKIIREQIINFIYKVKADSYLKTFSTGEELLNEKEHFDIIFLDIQMDGMNGIEVAKTLRERQEEAILIFITGIKEYVFEAFDVLAFHYLLKPIDEPKFIEVFRRAIMEVEKRKRKNQETILLKLEIRALPLTKAIFCISRAEEKRQKFIPLRKS